MGRKTIVPLSYKIFRDKSSPHYEYNTILFIFYKKVQNYNNIIIECLILMTVVPLNCLCRTPSSKIILHNITEYNCVKYLFIIRIHCTMKVLLYNMLIQMCLNFNFKIFN